MIEQKLYAHLSTYTTLTALIGSGTACRLYPLVARQTSADPYCAYQTISSPREYTHGGYASIRQVRMQVSCYSKVYATAKAVAAAVVSGINAFPNTGGVKCPRVTDEQDLYDAASEYYHVPVEFTVWYQE